MKEKQSINKILQKAPRQAWTKNVSLPNSEHQLRRALTRAENEVHPPDSPELVPHLDELADVLQKQFKYKEAGLLYKRSLAIREKNAFGRDDLEISWARYHVADCCRMEGKIDTAAALFKKTLEVLERDYPDAHNKIAATLLHLGLCYPKERSAEAEPLLKRSEGILEKERGPNDPELATVLNKLAGCYQNQGKWNLVEPARVQVLSITEKAFPKNDPHIAGAIIALADCYEHLGRTKEAELLRKRVGIVKSH